MTSPLTFDGATFRHVLGHYPTGVSVITAASDGGQPVGMVVGSFGSVSLDPPLVAFFPDRRSSTWPHIESAGRFCANVLAEDQFALCVRLASRDADKFAGITHRSSSGGSPILDGVVAWIDCRLHAVHGAGDHLIVLGIVDALQVESAKNPLLFFRGGFGQFSHRNNMFAEGA